MPQKMKSILTNTMGTEEDKSVSDFDDDIDDDSESASPSIAGSVKEAKEDIALMNILRVIVIMVLLTIAFITGEIVLVIVTIAEEKNFEDGYYKAADQLIESFYEHLDNTLWAARTLSNDISSSATEWPYVAFPDFDSKCEGPLHMSGASVVSLSPLVKSELRSLWENFTATVTSKFGSEFNISASDGSDDSGISYFPTARSIDQGIYQFQDGKALTLENGSSFLFPTWQVSPALGNEETGLVRTLFEETSNSVRRQALQDLMHRTGSILSNFFFRNTNNTDFASYTTPRSSLYYPIYEKGDKKLVVASINMELEWKVFLENGIEPTFGNPILAIVENSCGGQFTFNVTGPLAVYGGEGDLHPSLEVDYSPRETTLEAFADIFNDHGLRPIDLESGCNFKITLHPSSEFKDEFMTMKPENFRVIVMGSFIFITLIFLVYDRLIERRQNRIVTAAERSDAIVRSLFPTKVRDQLYEHAKKREEQRKAPKKDWRTSVGSTCSKESPIETQKNRLKKFMNGGPHEDGTGSFHHSEPIADFFPNTTILFADIAGFTAWSSEREPTQVFTLLETVYGAMDKAARKFDVFKVETVGDCYVAATGIPDPQEKHAEIMVRFARATCIRIQQLTSSLEAKLGPGTADLAMRFGIHSGAVTAGVLRGRNARFQLFGDTMNTASRIESNGMPNKIHISAETAQILIDSGKAHWLIAREDEIHAKGKGTLQTYWVRLQTTSASVFSDRSAEPYSEGLTVTAPSQEKMWTCKEGLITLKSVWQGTTLGKYLGKTEIDETLERLVEWNVELLLGLLKSVVAYRIASGVQSTDFSREIEENVAGDSVLDEIKMAIAMPQFDAAVAARAAESGVKLAPEVETELCQYVAAIASGYLKNSFHNFEHASHVILATNKLLRRIVSVYDERHEDVVICQDVHEYAYCIGTEPLTQFAMVFAALVHDVGHPGVPNFVLAEENPHLAEKYIHRSIAEQQSVDIAWDLLLLPAFKNLRACIYQNRTECEHFRQLIVNSVIATDLFDKELKDLRASRWNQAFHGSPESSLLPEESNRKATIVIEHVIQASDIAHTMQHWYIYQVRRQYCPFIIRILTFVLNPSFSSSICRNGTSGSSTRCTLLTFKRGRKKTLRPLGTKVNFGSSITT
jgi:class 3 adenylate cyclase